MTDESSTMSARIDIGDVGKTVQADFPSVYLPFIGKQEEDFSR
jgi:hypothetical protein